MTFSRCLPFFLFHSNSISTFELKLKTDGPGKVRGGGDLVNNQGDLGESDLTTNIVTPNWSQLTTSGECQ